MTHPRCRPVRSAGRGETIAWCGCGRVAFPSPGARRAVARPWWVDGWCQVRLAGEPPLRGIAPAMPACISKSSGLDSRALAKLAVRRRVAGPACRPARPWKAPGKAPGTRGAVGRARALLGSDAPGGGAPARCDAARRAADPGSPCHAMSRWADMLLGGRGARWIGRWARNSVLLSQGCSQLSAVVRFGA